MPLIRVYAGLSCLYETLLKVKNPNTLVVQPYPASLVDIYGE